MTPEEALVWMRDSEDPSRAITGSLESVLKAAFERGGESTLYLKTANVLSADGFSTSMLSSITFMPDSVVFGHDEYIVHVSDSDPRIVRMLAATDGEPEPSVLYVWLEKKNVSEPDIGGTPAVEVDIFVDAQDYVAGQWSNAMPVFTLSGIPEDKKDVYTYAVIAYDERFVILSGNTYTARDEGDYDIRFTILDGIGDVLAKSAKYNLKLDFTPPEYVYAKAHDNSYTVFDVVSEDALSGLNAYSIDAGATWVAPDANGIYTHTAAYGSIFPFGSLMARDNAGNEAMYPDDFALPIKMPSYGGGGGGGGVKHVTTEEVPETTPYDTLELTADPELPMTVLKIGETELPLSLKLTYAQDYDIGALYEPKFTATFTRWSGNIDDDTEDNTDDKPDTLILTVVPEEFIQGEYEYTWLMGGLTCKLLSNSGIDYLVMSAYDKVIAISTAGFNGGSEYTRLKAQGVSTRKFSYELSLRASVTDPELQEMRIIAKVAMDDGELIYEMTTDKTDQMYYYDIYTGNPDMLDAPFGACIMINENEEDIT